MSLIGNIETISPLFISITTIEPALCLDNLVNGGQCGSGSETYPTINTASASHPNTSTPYEFSEFYGYDKDATSSIQRYRTPFNYGKIFFCFNSCHRK